MSALTDWLNNQAAANKAAKAAAPTTRAVTNQQQTQKSDFWGDTGKNLGNFASSVINWDVNGVRPVQDFLNKLTAGAAGTGNALTKYYTEFNSMSDQQYKDYLQNAIKAHNTGYGTLPAGGPTNMALPEKPVEKPATSLQGHFSSPGENWLKGFQASWKGDTQSSDYNLGHNAMEAASQGRLTLNPNMTETEKFWGGLGIDIAGDPLTYLPGGVIAAPIRGAATAAKASVRAVRAAEGGQKLVEAAKVVPKTVAGTVIGDAGAAGYKAGRFTGAPKPVGLQQWGQVRSFQNFEKAAKEGGVGTEDLLKLIGGETDAAALSAKLGGTVTGKIDYSPTGLTRLAERAAPFADDASKIHYGVWSSPTGARYQAKAYQGISPAGASAYLHNDAVAHLAKPENRIAKSETDAWVGKAAEEGVGGTPLQPQRIIVEDDGTGNLVARQGIDDGVLPSSSAINNTVGASDHEILGITPDMTPEAAYQQTLRAVHAALPENGGTQETWRAALAANSRLWGKGNRVAQPATKQDAKAIEATSTIATPSNPTIYEDSAETAIKDAMRTPEATATLEELQKLNSGVISEDFATAVTQRAAIMDKALETVLGADGMQATRMRLGLDPEESVARFFFGNDELIATIREGERGVVFQGIRELADLPIDIPGYTDTARKLVIQWENLATPAAKASMEADLATEYLSAMEKIGVAVSEDAEQVVAKTVSESGVTENVNIFGKTVDDAEAEIARVADDAIESAQGVAPKTGMTAEEYAAKAATPNSSNALGHSGADSLAYRETVNGPKGSASHLAAPNVPAALNDIYDHVVGFARKPLDFPAWVDALRRIAESTAAKAQLAADVLKRAHLEEGAIPNTEAAFRLYNREYLAAFDKAIAAEVKTDTGAMVQDLTTGVDFAGRIFRDHPGGAVQKAETAQAAKLREAAQAAKEAEAASKGVAKAVARAERRNAVGVRADAAIATEANLAKGAAGDTAKLTNPVTGDPIFARATDGAWLDGEALNKSFLRGSVSAFSENFVEHAKLVGDGLRNGFRRIAPIATWKNNHYRVFETQNIVQTDEQVVKLLDSLKLNRAQLTEAFDFALKDTLKGAGKPATPANVKAGLALIQKQLFKGTKFNEVSEGIGDYAGFHYTEDLGEFSQKLVTTPWRNSVDIAAVLDDALRSAGVVDDVIDSARGHLWDSIIISMQVSPTGVLQISPTRLDKLVRAVRIETGRSRPARSIEVKDGTLSGILRNVGSSLKDYNKSMGVKDVDAFQTLPERLAEKEYSQAAKSASEFLTAEQHGFNEMDINGLKELINNVKVTVTADGKQMALSSNGLREYDMETLRHVAEAIARSNGEQEVIAKFSSGETLANYLRARTPQIDDFITAERARRIQQVEAINNTSLWDGDRLLAHSKTISPEATLGKSAADLDAVWSRITSPDHRALLDNAAAAGYQKAIQHVAKAPSGVYRQESSIVAWRAISDSIETSGMFKPGSVESWNAKLLAMRKMRLQQQQSGVFDVTALSKWGGRTKPTGGIDADFAYIGAVDIVDAITSGLGRHAAAGIALPDDAARVLFDTLKIDGKTFPMNVAQELGVLSMKMLSTEMDDMARVAWLHDSAIFLLKKSNGYEGYAKAAQVADSPAARAVAMLATALSNKNVAENLMLRHVNRGGMAIAVAEKNSVAIAKPIMDALTAVADNVFATSGERALALDKSIDALRKDLVNAGYAKGSLEHLISTKKLETHALDTFTPMQHNTARVQRRMNTALETPLANRVFEVNAERAMSAKLITPVVNDAVIEGLARNMDEAIRAGGTVDTIEPVLEQALHSIDQSVEGGFDMQQHLIMGSDLFNTPEPVRVAGRDATSIREIMDDLTSQYADAVSRGLDGTPEVQALAEEIKHLRVLHQDADELYMALKEGREPANLDEIANNIMAEGTDTIDGLSEAVVLESQRTKSLAHNIYATFSGQAGKRDLLAPAGVEAAELQKIVNHIETSLEDAYDKAVKAGIDEATQRSIMSQFMRAKTPEARLALAQKLAPEQAEFAKGVYDAAGSIIDGSSLIRAGLSSNWLNKHLGHSILANTGAAKLPPDMSGTELVEKFQNKLIALIEGKETESLDWLSVLKGFNTAIGDATHLPNVAADFSAKFGHKAHEGLTEADAISMGWVQIKPTGNLAQFIDRSQFYPKDMVEQLANMEKFYDDLLAGKNVGKFVRGYDRTVGVVKSSLTLWTPRNHMVNALGEYWTNILAGVYSPKWYKQASQVMYAGGMLKNVTKHNYSQTLDHASTGVKTLDDIAEIPGGKWRIGKNVQLTDKEKFDFFNANGVILANNSIEDFVREASETIKRGNVFTKMTSPIWKTNRRLAEFASRRDNLFRIAHAEHIMETKAFRSLDEAADYIRREISEYHPTMHHLSPFEQKYMRRIMFFYTWQRGALKKTIESVMEHPERFAIAPKLNFELSAAMGGDPQSVGHPAPNDPRLPSWAMQNISGPSFYTEGGDVINASINSMNLDILQKYFGGIQYDPRRSFWDNTFTNMQNSIQDNTFEQFAPPLKAGLEMAQAGSIGQKMDWGQWLTDQTGLGSVSRATGFTPVNDRGIGPFNSEGTVMPYRTGVSNEREWNLMQQKAILGLFTPFKPNMVSEYDQAAQRERTAAEKIAIRRAQGDPTLPWYQK